MSTYAAPPPAPPLSSYVSFSIYHEDGRPAPPKALDSAKERGETFVAFGTLVAPLTDDSRMKLVSLDVRLKGRVPPCLPKSLDGGAPEPLPWVPVAASAAVTPRGGGGGGGGGGGKKPKPKAKGGGKPPIGPSSEGAGGARGGPAEGSDMWRYDGGCGGAAGGGGGSGMWDGQPSDGKRARKSNARYEDSPDKRHHHGHHPQQGGGSSFERSPYQQHPPPPHPTMERSLLVEGRPQNGSQHSEGAQGGAGPGAPPFLLGASSGDGGPCPPSPLVAASSPTPVTGSKKRKACGGGGGGADAITGSSPKKPKPPPSFSLATFAGGLDGSETRGLPQAEFVGSCFQRGRKDGLLLYYVDKAPRDYPFEYESKAAGAASLDWSLMRKHLKVDAFCMETFRWYGAKVADVSQERRQVKVRAGGLGEGAKNMGLWDC